MNRRIYDNYVIQIVEHGSLTAAAKAMGLSQPALSSGLAALEKSLGFSIFDRHKLPFTLTDEGKIYYEYVTEQEQLDKELSRRLASLRSRQTNSLSVGGSTAYVESMITRLICENPDVFNTCNINIKIASISALIEQGISGDLECFVSTTDSLPQIFDKRPLRHERIYLVIHRDNPINKELAPYKLDRPKPGKVFDYSILSGQKFIFLEKSQPLQKQMEEFFLRYNIDPVNRITVNQVSTALNFAMKGGGICFATEAVLRWNASNAHICLYTLPDIIMGRNIYIAFKKDAYMSQVCRTFIDMLVAQESVS